MTPDRLFRGEEIARRRVALGIHSASELAQRTGLDRKTVAAAEAGTASRNTYVQLEHWLDMQEDDGRMGATEEGRRVEFRALGPTSEWRLEVSGPPEDAEQLRKHLAALVKELGWSPNGEK